MIKIIKPRDHKRHKSKIEALLDLFTVYQKLDLSPEEKSKATFIIAEDKEQGVYGGAILHACYVREVEHDLWKIIKTISYRTKKVWAVKLCFPTEEKNTPLTLEQYDFYLTFYRSLLFKFIEFGKNVDTRFFIFSLHPSDVFGTKMYGFWKYLIEVLPKDSEDGLFHGLLALKPALCRLTWVSLQAMIKSKLKSFSQSEGEANDHE